MKSPEQSTTKKQQNTVHWVVTIAAIALIFDGYDLVVYGTIVPTLLNDPTQLGQIGPATAGVLGSWALLGVMVGALVTGAIGDYLGRRKIMITGIIWFSVFMGLTALAPNIVAFGALRFATGLGVGALVATAGAVVAEFAPKGKRNYYNAIVYSGVPVGGVLASVLAIVLMDHIGWRGLFFIGATPLLFLLPMALVKLPESPEWLMARGRTEEAQRASLRTGVPIAAPAPTQVTNALETEPANTKIGFRALASRKYALPTLLLGLMSFAGLMLTYGLNTWLPQIMSQFGYGKSYSLVFLLVLNAGAVVGGLIASVGADRIGAKRVVSTTFFLAAVAMILLTMHLPFGILLALVAVAGVGTIGTQVLIYGFVSNYYNSAARGAGVAWCAGFGRLGGIFGPLIGGLLIAAGVQNHVAFYVFAAVAIVGAMVTAFVPLRNSETQLPASPSARTLIAK
ncbi:MFS transporter [Arthrobacter alpinus]|uniref:MFS transporter n=1 Tax=Arthrobacter alpinus TaxID=656366 RepID=A0A0S2LYT6_9MICC|nr:aromatic acid/H+ symport family MFS transporter [Arthrobacter alpinus]ALO66637.1 MFS transporter [Arthrobacter alpinus]